MSKVARRRIQRVRKPKGRRFSQVVPLTQDWAESLYSLVSAANLAMEMGEKTLSASLLREARRILTRGEEPPP